MGTLTAEDKANLPAYARDYFYNGDDNIHRMAAFADIGHGVRKAATNAEFYDQMGEEFDLRMKPVTNSKGESIAKRPTIQVKSYDVYKYGEIGTVINGVTVTEDMVGERKSNVPIEVTVTAKDKTIYYDGEVDTDKDNWEGDELLQQITAGGKPVAVDTVTNPDGTTTTTFKPEADWMDDFATMDWADGSTTDTSDLSNTEPKDYTYTVVVTPNTDGSQNNGTNPGSTDNIAGEPQPTQGERADDTGHIYILVPELTFKDSVTDFGTDVGGYDFDGRDFVDEKIVWVDMELGRKPGDGIPELDQNAKEPELEYTPEGSVTQFVGDTGVDVTVSINDRDITELVKFNWENCGHTEHGSCGTINTHEGEDAVHEFWVHTTISIVPDTVVIDYGLSVDIDPLTNDLTHVKNVTKTLKHIDYAGTFGQAQVVGNEVRYTLNTANGMQMDREETFQYRGTYSIKGKGMDAESTITVIPATIIYYEDSFLTYESFAYKERPGSCGRLWRARTPFRIPTVPARTRSAVI